MKEKAIEKIPYIGLQKISRIKSVKYIGVTAVKNIGHQRHLLLEVYKNKKESKKIPVVRITLTKKDFGTYWPDKHVWTRQQLSAYSPIWMETYTGGTLTDENILQSPEDLERIKNFCGTKLFDASWWWEHISRYEADITSTERINRVVREHKRRQEALKDRQANTKALPEKAILYRADHAYFHDEHFLYYKKHGSRADIACSKCGGVTTARWKSSGAYEDQFERNIEEPRENSFGTCPMRSKRLNREAWQIMSRLLEQEKSKRMIPPTEIQTAEKIIKSLQTGPRNRQEKRALQNKLRPRKNPHKSLKNQSLRTSKRKPKA